MTQGNPAATIPFSMSSIVSARREMGTQTSVTWTWSDRFRYLLQKKLHRAVGSSSIRG